MPNGKSLIFTLLCLSSPLFAQQQWAVIASSYDTKWEAAYTSNKSLYENLQEAIASCRQLSKGQECFAVATVRDGCLAWAVDRRGHWGFAFASPGDEMFAAGIEELHQKAVDNCRQDALNSQASCQVVKSLCTANVTSP